MTNRPYLTPQHLQYYYTASYPCTYIAGRMAKSQVVVADEPMSIAQYSALVQQGFRRSGAFVYRPYCDHCNACMSIRIAVKEFVPDRSQRRAWTQHAELQVAITQPHFSPEHYALYMRYQQSRHSGGGMDLDDVKQYMDFLVSTPVTSLMVEFRLVSTHVAAGELKMVSIIDQLDDALSAVYTFFDPGPGQSLGTFNVMWQIRHAMALGLSHLYLGYWIESCTKMSYKTRFQPSELLTGDTWHTQHGGQTPVVEGRFTK